MEPCRDCGTANAATHSEDEMLSPFQLGKPDSLPTSESIDPASDPISQHIARIRAAALAGEPVQPVVVSVMHALGFEQFSYAITTNVRPTRDSRSFMWTT